MTKPVDCKIPIQDFLFAYRSQPCLYNTMLDEYKNRMLREKACETIIKYLKIPQLTVSDIKLKIKSVRTVYTKELRILMREKELGRAYKPKLFWFKLADSFLRAVSLSHCKRRKHKYLGVGDSCAAIKPEVPSNANKITYNTEIPIDSATVEEDSDNEQFQQATYVEDNGVKNPKDLQVQAQTTNSVIHGNESRCVIAVPPDSISNSTTHTSQETILTRLPNKTEMIIDDTTVCIMEQQPQPAMQQIMAMRGKHPQHPQQNQRTTTLVNSSSFASPPQSLSQSHSQSQNSGTDSANTTICFPALNGAAISSTDDDLIIFGHSIASQLRSITDSYSRSVAKLRIQQVLFEAETGQFQSVDSVSPHLHAPT